MLSIAARMSGGSPACSPRLLPWPEAIVLMVENILQNCLHCLGSYSTCHITFLLREVFVVVTQVPAEVVTPGPVQRVP
jgi:hypothetical protein